MGRFISTYVPKSMQKPALLTVNLSIGLLNKIVYFGLAYRCPVCNSRLRRFRPLIEKHYSRLSAKRCPVCKSLERHRWVWLYLNEKTNLFDGQPKKMLHIAPETRFARLFQKIRGMDYLSGDIEPGRAMETIDITDIRYPDNTFDIIYCSHVLEHVPDDKKAVSEFFRVLKPGGWALILVPITGEKTVEDAGLTDPEEKRKKFGHPDHVRICGLDYSDRLRHAGFEVAIENPSEHISKETMRRYGLNKTTLFFCKK